ncbi:creatininase family protein [Fodinicola acaciae]|uniref:creatininase family protein n=1 Tax=Fodinicola acaciae TaxID=2681555 RepID=UPI0013D77DCD|nr:creatininase family protein [Fodinicola acaciae]
MTSWRTRNLGEMGWTEAREAAEKNPVVLLPVGTIEQHGPHLPLHEDSIVAEYVAKAVAEATDALVLPTMMYGHSPTFRGYAGTINLRHETLTAVITDICDELIRHGFRRIVIVNNNGGNTSPVATAAVDLRARHGVLIGTVYPWSLGYQLMRDQYDDPAIAYGHGAEPELSAMLAMFPEQVRMDAAEGGKLQSYQGWQPTSYVSARVDGHPVDGTVYWDFSDVSPSGVTGDVTVASKETGQVWIDRVIGFCVDFVKEYDRNTVSVG